MSNNNNDDNLTPSLMEVFKELSRLLNWYEGNAKLIISIPLLINAGAVIALTSFFSTDKTPPIDIKYASLFFIVGTIFAIFTLIFEYLTSYFSVTTYEKHLFDKIDREKYFEELLKRYDSYNSGLHGRIMKTIALRIVNGGLCILFCFAGIFFITRYITNNSCWLILVTLGLTFYFLLLTYLLHRYNLNHLLNFEYSLASSMESPQMHHLQHIQLKLL